MQYRDFLMLIRPHGFDEVGRQKAGDYELAVIGRREPILIPFSFPSKDLHLENGDDSELEDEVLDSIWRWIEQQLGRKLNPH
jgi:hypothetical protein